MSFHNRSNLELIATNDVFRDICVLLRIHKDKDFLKEVFAKNGWDVGTSRLKGWMTTTARTSPDFRPMPKAALNDFINSLKIEKLIDNTDSKN